jgi:dihydropteroate synthase
MIYQLLGAKPDEALNGTTVVNTLALMGGADILRVHDVREAAEAIRILNMIRSTSV